MCSITAPAGADKTEEFKMATDARVKVTLACTECKQRNYNTMKNKRNNTFVQLMEALGYDIELTYVKRESL